MSKKIIALLLIYMQIIFVSCQIKDTNIQEKTITVGAAASLTDVLEELRPRFEEEYDAKVKFTFAGSGALMTQIEQKAPIDVFFSASSKQMNTLKEEGLVKESVDLLGNELVLITGKDSKFGDLTFDNITENKDLSLAIGDPQSVPAGQYANELFENQNIKFDKELNLATDVRQVLSWVELLEVDAGIIYKTDALTSKKVKVCDTANQENYSKIVYPVAVVEYSKNQKTANDYIKFLQSKESMEKFVSYGFTNLLS